VVSTSELYGRSAVSRPIRLTCTARTTAAVSISPSPHPGARTPSPETSSPTPTTATAVAAKNGAGSAVRLHAPSSSGVNTTVRLMIRPALVAEVPATPKVSSVRTATWVHPSRTPTASSLPCGVRSRARRHTAPSAAAERT
jgi:hypothetical protein